MITCTGGNAFVGDTNPSTQNEAMEGDYEASQLYQQETVCYRRQLHSYLDGVALAKGSVCHSQDLLNCTVLVCEDLDRAKYGFRAISLDDDIADLILLFDVTSMKIVPDPHAHDFNRFPSH